MPAAIKLRVIGARELPIMDSPTDSTDAYVEVCFATTTPLRTRVQKRTLNPTWNQEFRIEVADDCDLQDCPLVLKCWDKDIMSADDEIGAVCIDLNPLLLQQEHVQLAGWFPLYDTLRGACGERVCLWRRDARSRRRRGRRRRCGTAATRGCLEVEIGRVGVATRAAGRCRRPLELRRRRREGAGTRASAKARALRRGARLGRRAIALGEG